MGSASGVRAALEKVQSAAHGRAVLGGTGTVYEENMNGIPIRYDYQSCAQA